jgi:histidinol-phosphate aminotransferase
MTPESRRSFIKALGAGGAAAALPFVTARGAEALVGERWLDSPAGAASLSDSGLDPAVRARLKSALRQVQQSTISLSSNENPNGASKSALDGVRSALSDAALYPYESVEQLRNTVADMHKVDSAAVMIGSGSSEILRMALFAFVAPQKHLVTAAPTYEDPAYYAQLVGARYSAVPVDSSLRLDLGRMATASRDAGLVYICNPNNPTGTLHSATLIADFVRNVRQTSRDTVILIDEAYHEYVEDPSHRSAVPLAVANQNVIVARTFSKAFGMAGLRVGYAIARPEVLNSMMTYRLIHGVNLLGARAANACVNDNAHVENERRLNSAAREFTRRWFETNGFQVAQSHANFIMVNIRRDSLSFQYSCAEQGVLVGRPFPPLNTHARISIGTMDQMRRSTEVFRRVLGRR